MKACLNYFHYILQLERSLKVTYSYSQDNLLSFQQLLIICISLLHSLASACHNRQQLQFCLLQCSVTIKKMPLWILSLERLTERLGLTVIHFPIFRQARPDFCRECLQLRKDVTIYTTKTKSYSITIKSRTLKLSYKWQDNKNGIQ